ncbi:hypothetical protein [Methanosarcina mazei]|uniref:Uncharacterized protein n=2 Tax=Methanosarcina mazei TaxID=2209 RepID=A0A6C0VHS2_METMZ|nr:hypothetical protein [Methanosarcina mazei]AKB61364.1 hypothetical protein MSMAP_1379 [Methanosarcina mazei SarPi]QIB90980.1 hypothetical protein FQU78_07870 [Methanosarcina mazei]
MQKQNEKGVTREATLVNSEQEDSYKNNSLVYNIDSNIYKDVGTSTVDAFYENIEEFKAAIEELMKIFMGFLPRQNNYSSTYHTANNTGIQQDYWTTFIRVIKRVKLYQMDGCGC